MTAAPAFAMMELMAADDEPRSTSDDAIVGRELELAALRRVVDTGGAALIAGDAGVGKTRLLSELIDTMADENVRVLVGHCLHFGGDSMPYLPISEALGRLARTDPDVVDTLRRDFPALDRLLPRQRLIGSKPQTTERTESADLFEGVLGALLTLAEQSTVLLVLEDVHWADSSTRDLVGFLLSRTIGENVRLIVTYRSDDLHRRHPLRPVVLEWARLPGVARITVAPLADDLMRALVQQRHGQPLSEDAVQRILARAGGNPFFAEQLLAEYDDSDQLPADLAELLLVRLERLSSEAAAVVKVASVGGRRVSHDILREITGLSVDQLDVALRGAVDAHVLTRTDADVFAFRHALLAEAVYDDLLPGERTRLHAAFVSALSEERIVGTDADLARHARGAVDLPTAYRAGRRAGAEAMRVGAPTEAMRHFESALELAERVGADECDRVTLTLEAADAAGAAGHFNRAVNLLADAVQNRPADLPAEQQAELLLGLVTHAVPLDTELDIDLVALSGQALTLVPADPPSALHARAMATNARVLQRMGRKDEAMRLATEARAIALGLRQVDIAADASTTLAKLAERGDDPERAVQLLEESVNEAVASGDLAAQLRSLHSLAVLRYDRGELAESRKAGWRVVELATEAGQPWAVYPLDCRLITAQAEYVAGHWDRVLEICAAAGQSPPAFAAVCMRAEAMAVGAGRGDTSIPDALDEVRPWWSSDGMIGVLSAAAAIDSLSTLGRVDESLRVLDDVVANVGQMWRNEWFMARVRLHALALGALADAAEQANAAERRRYLDRGAQLHTDVGRVLSHGSTRQSGLGPEGRAWAARGDAEWLRLRWRAGEEIKPNELVSAWESTVEEFGYGQPEGAGHVFEQARSRARLAAARQAAADQVGAQRDADAARQVARKLGAEPLLAELRRLGPGSTSSRRHTSDDEATLTAREQQVLRLVSEGRSNREIARSLFISDKTVSVHVSNILAKLGAAGRTEAAAIANRRGLLA
jgi:DNA-binding CsgD family transcriptional regulator/tetratricopeptide (TPR) repeat protein